MTITTSKLFTGQEPVTLRLEASDSTVEALELDPFGDERFDFVRDVIAIDFATDGTITIETCRTLERPSRETLTFEPGALEAVELAGEQCRWFALCDNQATTTRSHPILRDVPICDRCDRMTTVRGAR